MKLPVKVITAYEYLFFDVRERLPAKDYIVGYVLKRTELFKPQQVGRIWAYFAFMGGVIALQDLMEHYRELQLTDYSYLLTEPEPRKNRPPIHAAIERSLLVELTRDLDPALLLAKVGPALYDLPVIPDVSVFEDSWQEVRAGLAEFDKPITVVTDATEAIARQSG